MWPMTTEEVPSDIIIAAESCKYLLRHTNSHKADQLACKLVGKWGGERRGKRKKDGPGGRKGEEKEVSWGGGGHHSLPQAYRSQLQTMLGSTRSSQHTVLGSRNTRRCVCEKKTEAGIIQSCPCAETKNTPQGMRKGGEAERGELVTHARIQKKKHTYANTLV